MNDAEFQSIVPETVIRAADLVGWVVVDVVAAGESAGVSSDFEYDGIGLVLERDGERKLSWIWAIAGAQDAWVILDRRKGLIDRIGH